VVSHGAKKKIATPGEGWTYPGQLTIYMPMATVPPWFYREREQIAHQ